MKKTTNSSPYQFEGRIPLSQAIPLGLQHVMAMFIGNLTPLIIVMGACGLTADAGFAELRTALLQNAMIIAGIVTLVQMFSIGPVGGKVPIVMGTSSGFLGVLNNTVAACGGGVIAYGAIMGACIVGGIFEGILGAFLKPLRKFFPAIVTGSVVIAIGLSLLGVGINYFCGGTGKNDYGSLPNLFLGMVVLIVIVLLKHFAPSRSIFSSSAANSYIKKSPLQVLFLSFSFLEKVLHTPVFSISVVSLLFFYNSRQFLYINHMASSFYYGVTQSTFVLYHIF